MVKRWISHSQRRTLRKGMTTRLFVVSVMVLPTVIRSCPNENGSTPNGNGPTSKPQLISPSDGKTLDNGCFPNPDVEPTIWLFSWSDLPGASQYHLFIENTGATYPLVDDDSLTMSSYSNESELGYVTDENRLGWFWRVRAKVDGEWGAWSEERTFDVEPLNTDCE